MTKSSAAKCEQEGHGPLPGQAKKNLPQLLLYSFPIMQAGCK